MRKIILCLILASSFVSQGQNKKDIFILFDVSQGDNKKDFNSTSIIFSLKDHEKINTSSRHQLNYFLYDSVKQKKKSVKYSDFKHKLVSGEQATLLVDEFLETDKKRRFKTPYYYNNYFNHVYMYEKIDNNNGILYEVTWNWGIR